MKKINRFIDKKAKISKYFSKWNTESLKPEINQLIVEKYNLKNSCEKKPQIIKKKNKFQEIIQQLNEYNHIYIKKIKELKLRINEYHYEWSSIQENC